MLYLNQNYTNQENSWNLQEWSYLVNEVSKTFRLTIEERKLLETSPVAKIIATIPFEAKCIEPERTAIAHLCLYMAEKKGFKNIVLIKGPMILIFTNALTLFLLLKVEIKK